MYEKKLYKKINAKKGLKLFITLLLPIFYESLKNYSKIT